MVAFIMRLQLPIFFALLSVTTTAYAQSIVQNPPVARVDFAYTHSFPQSLIFPPATSTKEASTFNYTILSLPNWLSFTAPVHGSPTSLVEPILTFSGTPRADDEGSSWVSIFRTSSLEAEDTPTRGFRIYVSSAAPPTIGLPFSTQILSPSKATTAAVISSAYPFSSNGTSSGGLRIPSTWSFSVGFLPPSFQSNTSDTRLYYSASLTEGQPLPSWLVFTNTSLTFDGTTPDLSTFRNISSLLPVTLNVSVGCTDVWNTGPAISQSFELVVTPDKTSLLSLGRVNTTVGSRINYNMREALEIAVAGIANATTVDVNAALDDLSVSVNLTAGSLEWLSWNRSSSLLAGTVPISYLNTTGTTTIDVPVPVSISFTVSSFTTAIANISLPIAILPYPFNSTIALNISLPTSVHLNDTFTIDLTGWLIVNGNATGTGTVQVNANATGPLASGLRYDASTNTLQGVIPPTLSETDLHGVTVVSLTIADEASGITSTNEVVVSLPSSLLSPSAGSSNPSASTDQHARGTLSKGGIIALSIIASLLFLLGLVAVLFCLFRSAAVAFDRDRDHPVTTTDAETPSRLTREKSGLDFKDSHRASFLRYLHFDRKSYRASKETTAETVVGSGGGGGSGRRKHFGITGGTPRDGSKGAADGSPRQQGVADTPTRQGQERSRAMIEVLKHTPSISLPKSPKAREPDFDMVQADSDAMELMTGVGLGPPPTSATPPPTSAAVPEIKPLSPSPKRPQAAPAEQVANGLPPSALDVHHDHVQQTHSRNTSTSTNTLDKPKRMGVMAKVFQRKSSKLWSRPGASLSSQPENSEGAASPDMFGTSGSSEGGLGGDRKRRSRKRKDMEDEDLSERGMSWMSSMSTDTYSSTGLASWESEQQWRQHRRDTLDTLDEPPTKRVHHHHHTAAQHTKPRRSSHAGRRPVSPSRSSGLGMAEKLGMKMAKLGRNAMARVVVDPEGTPDSVIPRQRSDFRRGGPRPAAGWFSDDEGEFVTREEDVFGVVKPVKPGNSSRRGTKEISSVLLPSMVLPPSSESSPRDRPAKSKSVSGSEADEVGRSFPDESLHYQLYWQAEENRSDDEDDYSDECDDDQASYHEATVGHRGNQALRQALVVSPLRVALGKKERGDVLSAQAVSFKTLSPVTVNSSIAHRHVHDSRRDSDSNRSMETPELLSAHSPPYMVSPDPHNSSLTSIDTPSMVPSAWMGDGRLRGLSYATSDMQLGSIYPLSQSKHTVRLVPHDEQTMSLSPDSVSSIGQRTTVQRSPTIVIQDTSDFQEEVPIFATPACKAFNYRPKLTTASGRSTPLSPPSADPKLDFKAFLESGEKLPQWLNFDKYERELWGTPPVDYVDQHLAIKIVAEQRHTAAADASGRRTPVDLGPVVGRFIMVISCTSL